MNDRVWDSFAPCWTGWPGSKRNGGVWPEAAGPLWSARPEEADARAIEHGITGTLAYSPVFRWVESWTSAPGGSRPAARSDRGADRKCESHIGLRWGGAVRRRTRTVGAMTCRLIADLRQRLRCCVPVLSRRDMAVCGECGRSR